MLGWYSRKRRHNARFYFIVIIWESKSSWEHIFRLSESLKPKIFATIWCYLRDILGLLQTSRFELLGGWNVCESQTLLSYYFKIRENSCMWRVKKVCEAIWKHHWKPFLQIKIIYLIQFIDGLLQSNCLCTCSFHAKC